MHYFLMVTADAKWKDAIYHEIGRSPNRMFPMSHILPLDIKYEFVQRRTLPVCECEHVCMVGVEGRNP